MVTEDIEKLKYSLGGLLYAPAMNRKVPRKIRNGAYPYLTSMAFCLEDTIQDDCLEEAEECLGEVLRELMELEPEKLPPVFIRIRTPEHMRHVMKRYDAYRGIITAEELVRYGELGRYKIRPMTQSDIQFYSPAFSKTIVEWNWNDNVADVVPEVCMTMESRRRRSRARS